MRHVPLGMVLFSALLVACFCGLLVVTFGYRGPVDGAGAAYLSQGAEETGAANLVSAIYLNYRLYDTLFEILVFPIAVLGVRFYLIKQREEETVESIPESQVVRTSADLLSPFILLIGIYLVLFGHRSPGGGFSGGVVAGSGLLLCAVALGADVVGRRFHEVILEQFEWGVLLVIFLLALLPITLRQLPLTDLLPPGRVGSVISGGSILIYNVLIGVKVFIGTWVVIHYFIRYRGEI